MPSHDRSPIRRRPASPTRPLPSPHGTGRFGTVGWDAPVDPNAEDTFFRDREMSVPPESGRLPVSEARAMKSRDDESRRQGPSFEGRGVSTLARLRRVIARVPRGKVTTYGQVAEAAGFPGGARLTVRALQGGTGLPWHRVVGAGGRIALRGDDGREQRLRLEIEGVKFRGGRVRMDLHGWTPRTLRRRHDS